MTQQTRIESDSMGEVSIPANALYGASTQRACENFPISGLSLPRRFIMALGLVKRGQSSNDVIPTTLHVSAALALQEDLVPALQSLRAALADKSAQWSDTLKLGRTHLMDATQITLGQEFSGYERQVA